MGRLVVFAADVLHRFPGLKCLCPTDHLHPLVDHDLLATATDDLDHDLSYHMHVMCESFAGLLDEAGLHRAHVQGLGLAKKIIRSGRKERSFTKRAVWIFAASLPLPFGRNGESCPCR